MAAGCFALLGKLGIFYFAMTIAALTPIYLRPHHLLCILTYRGYGYGDEFVTNFNALVAQINAGAAMLVRRGPDAICAPLCQAKIRNDFHCDELSTYARDDQAAQTLLPLLGDDMISGRVSFTLDHPKAAFLRQEFKSGRIRQACQGCQWFAFCSEIADQDFSGTLLLPTT